MEFLHACQENDIQLIIQVCEITRCQYEEDIGNVLANLESFDQLVESISYQMMSSLMRLKRMTGQDVEKELLLFTEGYADGIIVSYITEICRCIRNAATNSVVQDAFRPLIGPLVAALPEVRKLGSNDNNEGWIRMVELMGNVILQTLSNLIVQNPSSQAEMVNQTNLDLLAVVAETMIYFKNDQPICRYSVANGISTILYNCILDSNERSSQIAAHVRLMQSLLGCAALSISKMQECEDASRPLETYGFVVEFHGRMVWMVGHMLENGNAEQLFEHDAKLQMTVLSLWLGHRLDEEDSQVHVRKGDRIGNSLNYLETYLESLFDARKLADSSEQETLEGNSEDPFVLKKHEHLTLRLLGSYSTDPCFYLLSEDKAFLLSMLIQRLSQLNKEHGYKPEYGLRGEILRVIANTCYRRACNQDAIRHIENGIFTVLNQCNVDENSPYLREWGILAIRNLCEGNEENQELITNLRVQGTVQSSLIEKAGLKVELMPDGKAKLQRI